MTILITGGAGYIGRALVRNLASLPDVDRIIIYDNFSSAGKSFFFGNFPENIIEVIDGDILDTIKLESAISQAEIVYHLAAYTSFPFRSIDNIQYDQVNRWGTLNLMRCLNNNSTVKKLVFLSSTAVYPMETDLDAKSRPKPSSAYGRSKWEAEKYVDTLASHVTKVIFRCANVFGYNEAVRLDGVMNNFLMDTVLRKHIKIHGDGEQKRCFIEVGNLVRRLANERGADEFKPLDTVLLLDFNCSMNELRDALLSLEPLLEYTYVSRDIQFPTQSFKSTPMNDEERLESIGKGLAGFKEVIRVSLNKDA